jgi:hypothetical protein
MEHVSAPKPTSKAGAVQSQRTRVSAEALLSSEAGSGVEGRVAVSDPFWMARRVRSLWARGNIRALIGGGEGSKGLDT